MARVVAGDFVEAGTGRAARRQHRQRLGGPFRTYWNSAARFIDATWPGPGMTGPRVFTCW